MDKYSIQFDQIGHIQRWRNDRRNKQWKLAKKNIGLKEGKRVAKLAGDGTIRRKQKILGEGGE